MANISIEPPNELPKLVNNARLLPEEEQRKSQASAAYEIFGAVISYRLENGTVVYYEPTEDQTAQLLDWQKQNRAFTRAQALLKRATDQIPYFLALYSSTFLGTLLCGGIWLFFRIPKDSSKIQS